MKLNEEQLKQTIEELYEYYYGIAKNAMSKPEDEEFSFFETKAFGAVDALGAVYLACFGGKAMMELWLKNCEEPEE